MIRIESTYPHVEFERPSWHDDAACISIGADAFFPESGDRPGTRAAKRICASCVVRSDCLTVGLSEPWGIWGGMTHIERRKLGGAR